MDKKKVIRETEDYVRKAFASDSSGHDWWHAHRVRNLAVYIATKEKADPFIVEMGALLHDIADFKFNDDESAGIQKVKDFLSSQQLPVEIPGPIIYVINNVSFKGAGVQTKPGSIEAMVVQDADRLDAIGAIGIARTFAYGGHTGREMYNPNIKPVLHESFEKYKNNSSPTLNHFYEKLLLLKDRMNTEAAKELAEKRHKFMEQYLKEFFLEWDGKA